MKDFYVAVDQTGHNEGFAVVSPDNCQIAYFEHRDEASEEEAESTARLLAAALNACQMVVDRWERGDLDEAARSCAQAVEMATGQAGPPKIPPIVIEVRGGCVVEVTGLPAGVRYEVKDWDNLEADEETAGRAA